MRRGGRQRVGSILMVATLAGAWLGSACAEGEGSRGAVEDRTSGEAAARETRVTVLYSGASEWVFSPSWDDAPKFLLFLPLMSYTATWCQQTLTGLERSGTSAGGLAESWERSEDWRVWTVRLRDDVRWHDGVPVTARDIAFNVRLWKHPDVAWYGAAPVEEAEALDDRTVRFTLRAPGRWPLEGWDVFYPAHLMEGREPGGFFDWELWTRPVGNGPFRYVRHVPRTMVELEANPDYPLGGPAIDRVVLQFAAGGESGLVELLAGNVDMLGLASPLEASRLADDPRFHIYYSWHGLSEWLIWNHRHPTLGDRRVRRALTLAMDRHGLALGLGLPEGLPVTDAPYTACQIESGELPPPWPHDPAEAGRLLDEAGWREGRGGLRERDGRPLRFTLTFNGPRHGRVAVLLQAQLRRVGVAVDLLALDGGLVHRRFRNGEFDAIISPAVGAHRIVAGDESPVGAPDPELARLMARARAEPDPTEEDRLYRVLADRYREVLPATYLHPRMGVLVAHRRVRGLGEPGRVLDRPGWRWPFGGLEHLWVEEER